MMILDLCGGSGSWSQPWRDAGAHVLVVDPAARIGRASHCAFITVQEFLQDTRPYVREKVHGILMAPPCTEFAGSGARWRKDKPPELLAQAIDTVRACLRCVEVFEPHWWALENPIGRIAACVPELGKPRMYFDPCDYGDPYTKRTALWGSFREPAKHPVAITHRKGSSHIHRAAPGPERAALRSLTPPGFAQAFYAANP